MAGILIFAFQIPLSYAQIPSYPAAKLKSLDKITARTQTMIARVGQSVSYGPLEITVRTCRKSPPIEAPRTAAFLEIREKGEGSLNAQDQRLVFSGWMFASSPALSSLDHPVYDVWVIDCVMLPDLQDTQNIKAPKDQGSNSSPEQAQEQQKSLEQTIQDQQYSKEAIQKAREDAAARKAEQEAQGRKPAEDGRPQSSREEEPGEIEEFDVESLLNEPLE